MDLAIEIPRPDAACRERLFRVYIRDLAVDADLDPVVAGTEGVTASFIKEMIRRTVLASLRAGERPPVLRGPHFASMQFHAESVLTVAGPRILAARIKEVLNV